MEEQYENERILLEEKDKELKRRQRQQKNYDDMGGSDATLYERIRNGATNFHTWKDTLDPWAVFEDFFFQDPIIMSNNGANTGHQQQSSPQGSNTYQSYYDGRYQQQQPSESHRYHHTHTSMPPRVSETTIHRGYDPTFGADIYTVLRREEYIHDDMNNKGQYYYQILGQDFVSGTRVDPYTGFTLQEYYSAVTEPYFVEDGWANPTTSEDTPHFHNTGYEQSSQYQQQYIHEEDDVKHQEKHNQQRRKSISKLEVGESFTPNNNNNNNVSDPWISPNGKYQVKLTSTCELQFVSINNEDQQQQQKQNERHQREEEEESQANDDEKNIIWSSETYIPNARAHGCYLTLNTLGRLVLSVDYGSGLTSLGNTVLWNTPTPPVVPHLFQADDEDDGNINNANANRQQQPVTFRYYASLDDDGVIAVYRVREKIKRKNAASDDDTTETQRKKKDTQSTKLLQVHRPIMEKLGGMYRRISKASAQQGQTKAAVAWDHLRYNVGRILAGRPTSTTYTHDGQQSDRYNSNLHHHHECVYATSLVGCLAPGRNAIHLSKKLARTLKRGVQTMDSHIDHFLSILTDQVDYYDDYEDVNYGYSGYESSSYSSDDDDEDLLDTLVRVTGAAGIQLGKVGMHGINRGKKVAGKVVGKMKDKMGKHSTRWGERMAEKEEFF